MLIISCHEPYSSVSFWLFGECPFEANEFSVSKVNCDGDTLLSTKKELKISLFFKNQQCTCLNLWTGSIDKHDHVISWNKDVLSQVSWLEHLFQEVPLM